MESRHDRRPTSTGAVLAWTFAKRELKSRYKGTLLGWLWSLIVPLAMLGLYAIVFGLIFRAQVQPMGNGHPPVYALWLYIGLTAYNFFANAVVGGANALWAASGLINKIRVSVLAPVLGNAIAAGMQALVEVALFLAVLAVFGNVGWTWLLLLTWSLLFLGFAGGLAVVMSVFAAYFRDALLLYAVLLQLLLFATPVMYPLTMIPERIFGAVPLRDIIGQAPLARFLEMARTVTYDLTPGRLSDWFVLVLWSALALAIGTWTARRFGQDVAEKLQ
ncbi:MAG TPA: ABC transporter permease [Aeromicrobium sp.]|nr:ABC transporter permease [Aeromicrobium sp.]